MNQLTYLMLGKPYPIPGYTPPPKQPKRKTRAEYNLERRAQTNDETYAVLLKFPDGCTTSELGDEMKLSRGAALQRLNWLKDLGKAVSIERNMRNRSLKGASVPVVYWKAIHESTEPN